MKEDFNSQEYRDNLAKDLKEIKKTDPKKAQEVLEGEKNTKEYKVAKIAHDDFHEQVKIQDSFERMDKERSRFNIFQMGVKT